MAYPTFKQKQKTVFKRAELLRDKATETELIFKKRLEDCKQNGVLQVHHDTYKNHFEELNHLEDLMTLCDNCHKEHHYAQQ